MRIPWLRWPRITLQRTFIALTVLCALLAAAVYVFQPVIAGRALRSAGARVSQGRSDDFPYYGPFHATLDGQSDDGAPPTDTLKHWKLVRRAHTLKLLDVMYSDSISEEKLACAPAGLNRLVFEHCSLTEEALLQLSRLDSLYRLWFKDCQIPLAALSHEQGPSSVIELLIVRTPIPPDLTWLKQFSGLEYLTLNTVGCDDRCLATWPPLPELRSLDLSHNDISDAGVQFIAPLELEVLDISHTRVSDRGLESLLSERLEWINLRGSQVSAEGIAKLLEQPSLKALYCDGALIDEALAERIINCQRSLTLYVSGAAPVMQARWDKEYPPIAGAPPGAARPFPPNRIYVRFEL